MIHTVRFFALLLCVTACLLLGACASHEDPVHSSGTPVNPFTDPGAADQPSAPSTGAQPRAN